MKKQITESLLQQLAGPAAFNRGLSLFEQGAVLSIEKFKDHILGTVQGTHTYAVDLVHTAKQFNGSCNCPASEGVDFCKHCVAVALHIMHETGSSDKPATSSAQPDSNRQTKPKKPTTKEKQLATIAQYLTTLTKTELEAQLKTLIADQPELRAQWLLKAESKLGLIDVKVLRKKLTAAIPYNKHLFYYDQVRNYFHKVETVIAQINEVKNNLKPEDCVQLGTYGLTRLNRALETVDDSGGYRFTSEQFFQSLIEDYFHQQDWTENEKLTWLTLNLKTRGDIKINCHPLIETLPVTAYPALEASLMKVWQTLPPKVDFFSDHDVDVSDVQKALVYVAEQAEDWLKVIGLYEKTSLSFVEKCDQMQREIEHALYEQAETRLKHLIKIAEDNSDKAKHYQLEAQLAEKLNQTQRQQNALWQAYLFSRKLNILLSLTESQSPKEQQALFKQAESHWKKQLAEIKKFAWHNSPVTPMVELLLHQHKIEQAYDIVQKYPSEPHLLMQVADHDKTPIKLTYLLYLPIIQQEIGYKQKSGYQKALKHIKKVMLRAENPLEKTYLTQVLQQLRSEHQRKTSFIEGLDSLLRTFDI